MTIEKQSDCFVDEQHVSHVWVKLFDALLSQGCLTMPMTPLFADAPWTPMYHWQWHSSDSHQNYNLCLRMSLLHSLPAPQQQVPESETTNTQAVVPVGLHEPPPYLRRTEFIPRRESDFGDGGAFPEIPVAQYPLGMGKQKQAAKTLAVTVDADGGVNYDAVVKQGQNRDKTVFSKHSDLVPKVDELNKLVHRL